MKIPNTYHFVATFRDGSQIFQNEDDVSPLDPTKNCLFDVLEREKAGDGPVSFGLIGPLGFFGVDLRDGHFEINGIPFFMHRPEQKGENYKDFRLISFRTPRINIEMDTKTGKQTPVKGWVFSYTFGWQVTHEGKNVKRTFTVYFE
jgi:hypothetical protein